jgi:hypothetical protein
MISEESLLESIELTMLLLRLLFAESAPELFGTLGKFRIRLREGSTDVKATIESNPIETQAIFTSLSPFPLLRSALLFWKNN